MCIASTTDVELIKNAIGTADKIEMKTVGIYDKYNYGQEEMKKIATAYIA